MKYQQAMIVWTPPATPGKRADPLAGKIAVVPFGENGPEPAGAGRDYMKSIGACFGSVARLTPDQVRGQVFIDFASLVREERMDVDRVHRAFMEIDEYRDIYLAEPAMGYARTDDSDPRVDWMGGEIVLAELPTWDEAVAEIHDAIANLGSERQRFADALAEAIIADVKQGREVRAEVQGLRLGILTAGLMNPDEALAVARQAADAISGG